MAFIVTGHRGAMDIAPENTLASFMLAQQCGVNEVELDLRLSRDGVLVVVHDETVDRTTNGSGAVNALTHSQLRELDAGDGEPVPTFDEVLAATDVQVQVEIKTTDVLEPFFKFVRDRPDVLPRLSPCSNNVEIVAALVDGLPASAFVGLTSNHASTDHVRRALGCGAKRLVLGWEGAGRDLIHRARESGLHFGIQPVNVGEQLTRALALGVDGFTTNDPRLVPQYGYELRDGALVRRAAVSR